MEISKKLHIHITMHTGCSWWYIQMSDGFARLWLNVHWTNQECYLECTKEPQPKCFQTKTLLMYVCWFNWRTGNVYSVHCTHMCQSCLFPCQWSDLTWSEAKTKATNWINVEDKSNRMQCMVISGVSVACNSMSGSQIVHILTLQ